MTLPQLLSVLVLANALGGVFSCGGSSPPPPCSWQTCRHEWRNDWAPGISTGHCVNQHRNAHHIYSEHHGSGSCPAPSSCSPSTQYRTMCSCTNAYYCPFHDWSGWTGSISQGTCGRQSRYRDYNQHIRYDVREGNCNGIPSSCGSRQYNYRDWCSCRYASCSLGSWSSWADLSSPVNASHCASQQRIWGYALTWLYTERQDNCNDVGPLACPSPQIETREKPTCAAQANPVQNVNAVKKDFTFYTGSCSADEQEALRRMRLNFVDAVKNSPMANYTLCSVSQGQECVVENVNVYCGTNSRRRRGLDSSERIISFDFVIHDKNASSDPKVEAVKLKKMMEDLDTLEKFLKESFPNVAHMAGMTVSAAASSAACPVGKVVVVVPGNNSELERTFCVECPAGTYFNGDNRTCEDCQDGTFQNSTGQLRCYPCPVGTWTVAGHGRKFTECFEFCEPGEYIMMEESGIVNCLKCPIGTYQPKVHATAAKCLSCPDGKTTAQEGSTYLSECQ